MSQFPNSINLPVQTVTSVMLLVTVLVPFVLLATRVVAGPTVVRDSLTSLPLSRHINRNGRLDLIQKYREKSRNSVKDGQRRSSSTPDLTVDDTGFLYVTGVGVGDPLAPTYCEFCQLPPGILLYMPNLDNLILDTASANTWLGAYQPYNTTPSSVKTGDKVVSIVSRADLLPSLN